MEQNSHVERCPQDFMKNIVTMELDKLKNKILNKETTTPIPHLYEQVVRNLTLEFGVDSNKIPSFKSVKSGLYKTKKAEQRKKKKAVNKEILE